YVYGDGASEKAAKTCLVDRYPRESYQIATKLNGWMGCHDEESAKKEFEVSLERLGCGYIDYYLLHAVKEDNLHFYNDWHLWDFIKEKKAQGLIKHIGFSY
ncbi:MAG TPA: Fe-S oxidoreductase, partial [Erysipelotrichaceae bacterium]|nr:Fe-S oxidoreductase [Erysipelotrichaceae bacterium]